MGGNYRWELGSSNEYSKGILGTISSVCTSSDNSIEDESRY